MPVMTEEQLDRVIQAAIPELKVALRELLSGHAFHIFDIAAGHNSRTGVKSKIVIVLAQEAPGAVLEGCCRGMEESGKIFERQMGEIKAS